MTNCSVTSIVLKITCQAFTVAPAAVSSPFVEFGAQPLAISPFFTFGALTQRCSKNKKRREEKRKKKKNALLLAAVQANDGEAVLRVFTRFYRSTECSMVSEQGVDVRARVPEVIKASASSPTYPTVSRPARTAKSHAHQPSQCVPMLCMLSHWLSGAELLDRSPGRGCFCADAVHAAACRGAGGLRRRRGSAAESGCRPGRGGGSKAG